MRQATERLTAAEKRANLQAALSLLTAANMDVQYVQTQGNDFEAHPFFNQKGEPAVSDWVIQNEGSHTKDVAKRLDVNEDFWVHVNNRLAFLGDSPNTLDGDHLDMESRQLLAQVRCQLFILFDSFSSMVTPRSQETAPWIEKQLQTLLKQKAPQQVAAIERFPLWDSLCTNSRVFGHHDGVLGALFDKTDLPHALRDALPALSPTFNPAYKYERPLAQLINGAKRKAITRQLLNDGNAVHELEGWHQIYKGCPLYDCLARTLATVTEEEAERAQQRVRNLETYEEDGHIDASTGYLTHIVGCLSKILIGFPSLNHLAAVVTDLRDKTGHPVEGRIRPTEDAIIRELDDAIIGHLESDLLNVEDMTVAFRERYATGTNNDRDVLDAPSIDDPVFINWDEAAKGEENPYKLLAHAQALVARKQFAVASTLPALTGLDHMDMLNAVVQQQERDVTEMLVQNQGRATMAMTDLHGALTEIDREAMPLTIAYILGTDALAGGSGNNYANLSRQLMRGMNSHVIRKALNKPSPFDGQLNADQTYRAIASSMVVLSTCEDRNVKGSSLAQVLTGIDREMQSEDLLGLMSSAIRTNSREINRLENPAKILQICCAIQNWSAPLHSQASGHSMALSDIEVAQYERLKASGVVGETVKGVTNV